MEKREVGSSRGFTLIELLVVIAIIAILAAILFPVFVRAKESAKVTACISNLSQIGHGLTMYMDDNGGRFPLLVAWGRAPSELAQGRLTHIDALGRYTRSSAVRVASSDPTKQYANVGVFRCPSDKGFPRVYDNLGYGGCRSEPYPVWEQSGSSYDFVVGDQSDNQGVNAGKVVAYSGLVPTLKDAAGTKRAVGAPMSALFSPSRKGVMGDMWNWHLGEWNEASTAHRNQLFADGHTARVRFKTYQHNRAVAAGAWYDPSLKQ